MAVLVNMISRGETVIVAQWSLLMQARPLYYKYSLYLAVTIFCSDSARTTWTLTSMPA